MPADRLALRRTFDEDAVRYDRARPTYPPALFDDLAALAGVGPGYRVLEIGCGTGQATRPLAERGCQVVAVELGAAMAAVARRNLAAFPGVDVVTTAFEDWPLPAEPFDMVLSATAFHWLDPAVRVHKTAAALRPGGALALVGTHHVSTEEGGFMVDVQVCYERWDPDTPPDLRPPKPDDVPRDASEVDGSGLFEPTELRRYVWDQQYTSAQYLDLLLTYSGHRALRADLQKGLLDCIAGLIDTKFGGRIVKQYMTELQLARRA